MATDNEKPSTRTCRYYNPRRRKTAICNHWKRGFCQWGTSCNFIHPDTDSKLPPQTRNEPATIVEWPENELEETDSYKLSLSSMSTPTSSQVPAYNHLSPPTMPSLIAAAAPLSPPPPIPPSSAAAALNPIHAGEVCLTPITTPRWLLGPPSFLVPVTCEVAATNYVMNIWALSPYRAPEVVSSQWTRQIDGGWLH